MVQNPELICTISDALASYPQIRLRSCEDRCKQTARQVKERDFSLQNATFVLFWHRRQHFPLPSPTNVTHAPHQSSVLSELSAALCELALPSSASDAGLGLLSFVCIFFFFFFFCAAFSFFGAALILLAPALAGSLCFRLPFPSFPFHTDSKSSP